MYRIKYNGRHMLHLEGKNINPQEIILVENLPENMTFFEIIGEQRVKENKHKRRS